jgi:hypothetical protein
MKLKRLVALTAMLTLAFASSAFAQRSQTSYVPALGTPVVDIQAFGDAGPIGGWAGRLQSTPAGDAEANQEEVAEGSPGEASGGSRAEAPAGSQAEAPAGSQAEAPAGSQAETPGSAQEETSEGSPQAADSTEVALSEELQEVLGVTKAGKVSKKKKRREEEEKEASQESPERMVVGVDSGGWAGASTFTDLAKGAISYIRTTGSYASRIEPESHAAGVHIATVVFGTGGSIAAINPSSYAAEIRSYFAKYGLNGALAVEVLNEPGNYVFWSDPSDYAGYAKLAKAVHEALATLPAASRPVELCSWDGGEASASPDKPWGEGIKAAGALPYCDGVTAHPYGGKTGGDGGALGGRKDVELAHTESGKPVYVTEIGWPTAVGQPPTGDSQQWTEAQQAANITGFMKWAAATGYVPMVIYFNFVDYGTNDFYGIETAARKHKLGFAALAEASARW